MKEIELKPETIIEVKAEQQKEFKLIGKMRKIKGLKLWEYNPETNLIIEIIPEKKISLGFKGVPITENKVFNKPGCLYVQAINYQNAKRKFVKLISQFLQNQSK